MKDLADAATEADRPEETGALIDHILTRYHEMHRADLASLGPLADRVERVHADDPDAPRGLARAIRMLAQAMEDHMAKEETILFPAMRAGGGAGIEHPIAVMRADHDDHAETVALIRRITRDLTPPGHACGAGARSTGAWRRSSRISRRISRSRTTCSFRASSRGEMTAAGRGRVDLS